jgi:predicted metalloprotease with PDZ domain
MKFSQILGCCVTAAVLAGCVSPSQMLVGPQGNTVRCSANGFGFVGAPLAEHSVTRCVADYKNSGYLPSEEAGNVGIQFSDATPNKATVSVVMPNSPARVAGILVGVQIIKVNGQQVLDRAAARTMMFGKAGGSVTLTILRNDAEMAFTLVRSAHAPAPG